MVGVIVVGSRGDDHVRTPLPYLSNDLKTDLQTRYQFSVVVVEYIVGYAQAFTGLLGLGKTALCQYASSLQLMAGIAVGDRYKFDRMAHSSEESGCSSGIQVTIIGMGADNDDAKGRCILSLYQLNAARQDSKENPVFFHIKRVWSFHGLGIAIPKLGFYQINLILTNYPMLIRDNFQKK